jgi:hypothetical protein
VSRASTSINTVNFHHNMVQKRKRGRSEERGKPSTPDAHAQKRKRSKSSKRAEKEKEIGKETRESRSVSINDESSLIKMSEMQPDTPKSKAKKTRKRASTSSKQLVADLNNSSRPSSSFGNHRPSTLGKSVGKNPSRETPREQPSESDQPPVDVTPSKKQTVSRPAKDRVELAIKEPKKKKPRRKPGAAVESANADDGSAADRGVGWNELLGRYAPDGPIYSGVDEDKVINTTEGVESHTTASPVLTDATGSKEKKPIVRRVRKYQPWNVNKHVVMSRDLLREARNIDLDPKIRQTLRQRLDLQKDTKAAFTEVIKSTGYSWSPLTPWDAAKSNVICDDLAVLASQSDVSSEARKAMLGSINAYRQVQLAINETGKERLPEKELAEPNINELQSAAKTIEGHVKLAQETLRNSLQQSRNIKIKHIHDGHWELHSKEYIKTWAKMKDTQEWELPTLLFQRNDCQLDNGERKHRCHVAGLLIGGEEFETHCLQIQRHASLEPVIAPTQAGRYVEGEEDICHIEMTFLGHGCMALQVPKRLIDRNIAGKRGPKSKAMVDFYGVQVARSEDKPGT